MKRKKTDATRERDQKLIKLMVERRYDERQARMTRLVQAVTGKGPDHEAACQLNQYRKDKEELVLRHYIDWDKNVYGPAAKKAFKHLNRPMRKSLSFTLETEPFRLPANASKDPAKRQLLQNASEKSFKAQLESTLGGEPTPRNLLQSRSRPVLEPDTWGMLLGSA